MARCNQYPKACTDPTHERKQAAPDSRGRIFSYCATCKRRTIQLWNDTHHQTRRNYQKVFREKVKQQVFVAYGSKCECCGEANTFFLTIDHINGDGKHHRKMDGNVYAWLRRRGFPKDGFRLFCFNCNLGRERNNGVCPHRIEEK